MRKIAIYLRVTRLQYYYDSDNNDDFTGLKQDILDKKSFTCNIIWTEMSA